MEINLRQYTYYIFTYTRWLIQTLYAKEKVVEMDEMAWEISTQ